MATKADATTTTPPKTEYVYVGDKGKGKVSTSRQEGRSKGQILRETINVDNRSVPKYMPRWLGNQRILGASWMVAMVIVGFDEWHNLGILPRPARLWDTSIVYGLLALAGIVDIMVPIVNAFAIGYTIMLLWQYYNGTGQFASTKGSKS